MESEDVRSRFVATCEALGFDSPPATVRVKVLVGSGETTLLLQPETGAPLGPLVDWVMATRPRDITFGSHRVMRATYGREPERWQGRYRPGSTTTLQLYPDGSAVADLTGARSSIQAFVARLDTSVELRHVAPAREANALLTPLQEMALRAAVDAGYYRIPRPLNLHQLAAKADVTAASFSERLRRAEGRVITQYVALGCPRLEDTAYVGGTPMGGPAP